MSKLRKSVRVMTKTRKYMVIEEFGNSTPKTSMFKIEEETLPELKEGQFLVKAEYISVDPYMRTFARSCEVPYLQFGFQVGKITQSRNPEYPLDTFVVSHAGWRDFTILDGQPDNIFQMKPYKYNPGNLPLSLAVGALGMPGITASLGFLEICKPQKGETVCVTTACGAVGCLVGQIARIKGCTVIGFTGKDEKVKILKELHFSYAYNYKTTNIKEALKNSAPGGINCFFDNVGGSMYEDIIEHMAKSGRVAKCGVISTYNEAPSPPSRPKRVSRDLHIKAFSFTQWPWERQNDAIKEMRRWIENGDIIAKETITSGFEKLPDAFISMLNGENVGKAVVKV